MKDKIGFVASAFDIYHPGYAMMLNECKENCDYLVVGLHENPTWEREEKRVYLVPSQWHSGDPQSRA